MKREMKPCNGCGQCCLAEKCQATKIISPMEELCPYLRFVSDGFYRCKLVEWEGISGLPPMIKEALAIGQGCTNETKLTEDNP
jgi:hypothetical protein